MTRGKQTAALALAGAVALASGAYALGSQADDGSAAAAQTNATAGGPRGFGHRPGFDSLADRLGVSEAELRSALEDIASQRRDDFAAKLADALGIDKAKVEQAFQDVRPERPPHPRHPRALAAALAKELGLSTAKVRAALEKRRGHPGDPSGLAADLGVSEQKLHEAFHAVFDKLRPRLPDRPGFGNLAGELGVTQQQLEDAFDKLRADHEREREQFAQELAKRLGLDPSKVQQALEESRPFPPHHP